MDWWIQSYPSTGRVFVYSQGTGFGEVMQCIRVSMSKDGELFTDPEYVSYQPPDEIKIEAVAILNMMLATGIAFRENTVWKRVAFGCKPEIRRCHDADH